eukprot:scaffold212133_cov17-Prasinocladus_malaysianus.AAC.1
MSISAHTYLDVRVGQDVKHHPRAAKAVAGHADGRGVDEGKVPDGLDGCTDPLDVHIRIAPPKGQQRPTLLARGRALTNGEAVAVGTCRRHTQM